MFIRFLICIIILNSFKLSCFSQNTNQEIESIKELQTQVEAVLQNMNIPGISIAIVNRNGPDWIAGLGKADLNENRIANKNTLFRIGSISKSFVSLAILILVSEGKLSLKDSLKKLIPEIWFGNKWEMSDPICVVHLLENTTGWDDMHLREFAKNASTMSLFEALDYDHTSRISRWRPGTRMSYCNSGPAVAAYIVEKITGKKFEEYVEEKLFKPIGMKTTTYFEPAKDQATTLYQSNGKTPHLYWDLLYRPIGSINASAIDMASYLLFYLNFGNVNGSQIIPASLFNRLESSSSTWAAQEGLAIGYGLGNYSSIYDGFVYHGHDGNVPGGLSIMSYMPKEGVGYFFSINSENREAFKKINTIIRAYITRELSKPSIPPTVSLFKKVSTYTGWYEPNSPRMNMFFFIERLLGMAYIYTKDNHILINSLNEKNAKFIPVNDTEFLYIPKNESPDPVPTLKLLKANEEGEFIQISLGMRNAISLHSTMKKISTELAILQIILLSFVLLTLMVSLVYAPVWIIQSVRKKLYRSAEIHMLLWPLIAVVSLLLMVAIGFLSKDLFILRLGNLTYWSFSLFLATIAFATTSVISTIFLLCMFKSKVRKTVLLYSIGNNLALMITTVYLAYWGIIGLRTWG